MDEAEVLCDRVAIMDKGRILKLDTPAALIRALDAPVRISINAGQLLPQQATGLPGVDHVAEDRSEEHTSELQSLMRSSYAVFCLKKKSKQTLRLRSRYPNN